MRFGLPSGEPGVALENQLSTGQNCCPPWALLIYLEGELSVGPLFTLSCLQHMGCVRLGLVFPSLPYGATAPGRRAGAPPLWQLARSFAVLGGAGRGPVGRCVTRDGPGEPRAERGERVVLSRTPACAFVSAFCWVSSSSEVEGLRPTRSGGLLKVTVGGEA